MEGDFGNFDTFLVTLNSIAYFVAIGLHLFVIVLTIVRVFSPRVKKIIDTLQLIGLIAYYRYRQEETAERALKVANAFNFNYLSTLICDKRALPSTCETYQHLIGPALTLLAFILLFFLSYIIAKCLFFATSP